MNKLLELSIIQARQGLGQGEFSCIEYVDALLAQAQRLSQLNGFVTQDLEQMRVDAAEFDRSRAAGHELGPLAGIPIALKDNINTATLPTGAGTGALQGRIPLKDAAIVERLLKSGAMIGGKTNMHELAFGITSNNGVHGPARNPYDPQRIPGGSSGGSAVVVAARMAPAAIGTDTGASVRLPAALCGIVGFRPSLGRYPMTGVAPIAYSRDIAGPMTRSVHDAALLDQVLADDASPLDTVRLEGLRLGVPREQFWQDLEPETEQQLSRVLARLTQAGAVLVETEIAEMRALNQAIGFPVAFYEFVRDFPEYLRRCGYDLTLRDIAAKIGSPDVLGIVNHLLDGEPTSEAAYRSALAARAKLQAHYQTCFESAAIEALVFPTAVLTASPIGDDETIELNGRRVPTFATFIRNTDPASNIGIPGISLPTGLAPNGLPVGLELDGPAGSDRRLLAVAAAVEAVLEPTAAPPQA